MTSSGPLVSVVIPTHDRERWVVEAIGSVLASDGLEPEIIVIDDGSTDGTPAALAAFGDRIRVERQANAGLGAARNRGHQLARGEFVAWMDSDDLCEPDRFTTQLALLRAHPELGLISTDFSAFGESGVIATAFAERCYAQLSGGDFSRIYPRSLPLAASGRHGAATLYIGDAYPRIAFGNFVHPPTVMMRRQLWEQAGPLESRLGVASDWEFLVRASRLATFAYLDRPLLRYRLSVGQMSGSGNSVANVPREMEAIETILDADPGLHASTAALRGLRRGWHLRLAADRTRGRFAAVGHLLKSFRYGLDPMNQGRAAIALLPDPAAAVLRRAWRFGSGMPGT